MKKKKIENTIIHALLILCILIISMPVILALIISTQSEAQVMSYPPGLIPGTSMVYNYTSAWNSINLGRMILNSTVIAFAVIFGKVSMSLLAAFAFTHFNFKGKDLLFGIILVTLLLPVPVRIVALFDVIRSMGLIDTYAGLVIPFWASATSIFILIQRFKVVPSELIDASKMDGCHPMQYFFKVLLPLTKSTIGALVVINFIYIWNQYLWPLMATNSKEMRVVQIGIKMLMSTESTNNWGIIMAGVIITMIPPLLVFIIMQESFMKGFALQSEK